MDHLSPTPTAENKPEPTASPRAYTLRIPKPNWQVTALILIAIIAAFQTFQLARLKGNVSAKASTETPASSTTGTSGGSSSGLQSQVGGC